MIEEAAGTRLYESKKECAQRTIEKKDAKLREIDSVYIIRSVCCVAAFFHHTISVIFVVAMLRLSLTVCSTIISNIYDHQPTEHAFIMMVFIREIKL